MLYLVIAVVVVDLEYKYYSKNKWLMPEIFGISYVISVALYYLKNLLASSTFSNNNLIDVITLFLMVFGYFRHLLGVALLSSIVALIIFSINNKLKGKKK